MAVTVCPLGLCRIEETCPNAPCLDCMRRLGEHMIEEIGVVAKQAAVARDKGQKDVAAKFDDMLFQLGRSVLMREMSDALGPVRREGQDQEGQHAG